jgi:hypothetical protein
MFFLLQDWILGFGMNISIWKLEWGELGFGFATSLELRYIVESLKCVATWGRQSCIADAGPCRRLASWDSLLKKSAFQVELTFLANNVHPGLTN